MSGSEHSQKQGAVPAKTKGIQKGAKLKRSDRSQEVVSHEEEEDMEGQCYDEEEDRMMVEKRERQKENTRRHRRNKEVIVDYERLRELEIENAILKRELETKDEMWRMIIAKQAKTNRDLIKLVEKLKRCECHIVGRGDQGRIADKILKDFEEDKEEEVPREVEE